jgi:glycosyltransferase involved in cell wall biosynthesis
MADSLVTERATRTAAAAPPHASLRKAAIMPAYNEADQIASVIAEIEAADPDISVIVVDDGSTDQTASEARKAGAEVLRLPYNLGIGGAVQTGYKYAYERGFQVAFQIDGDGQHDPGELDAIIEPVARDEADVVIGSRFLGLGQYRAPLIRRIGMAIFARFVSAIVRQPLSDTSSSFRAVNRRAMKLFASEYPHGYLETVEATVMASKYGLRMKEVPVLMRERMFGRSSLTVPLATFYAFKVFVAVFVSLFRRTTLHLEEDV